MPTITNEIWIAMALLAKKANNLHHCVRNKELKEKVKDLFGDDRSGVYTHISQHVVAQKKLNTGYNKCYLTAVDIGMRRLFLPNDEIHESRRSNPQKIPEYYDIPDEYQYLLDWYKGETSGIDKESELDIKVSISPSAPSKANTLKKDRISFSDFILNFDKAYRNFYISNSTYKNFREGPCIHFHRKAISFWKTHIKNGNDNYKNILRNDEYPEAIYATLTAWGVNRLGGGPKLKDYNKFKENLLSITDYLEEIRNSNISEIKQFENIIAGIYKKTDPSENRINLIAKSKTLHHLNPEVFPPIDRRYTLELLSKIADLNPAPSMNSSSFKNFWNILLCFELILNRIGFESVSNYIGKEIMDTSLTKIIDNAIIGFSDLNL